jgi:hypothetical protein
MMISGLEGIPQYRFRVRDKEKIKGS